MSIVLKSELIKETKNSSQNKTKKELTEQNKDKKNIQKIAEEDILRGFYGTIERQYQVLQWKCTINSRNNNFSPLY